MRSLKKPYIATQVATIAISVASTKKALSADKVCNGWVVCRLRKRGLDLIINDSLVEDRQWYVYEQYKHSVHLVIHTTINKWLNVLNHNLKRPETNLIVTQWCILINSEGTAMEYRFYWNGCTESVTVVSKKRRKAGYDLTLFLSEHSGGIKKSIWLNCLIILSP